MEAYTPSILFLGYFINYYKGFVMKPDSSNLINIGFYHKP